MARVTTPALLLALCVDKCVPQKGRLRQRGAEFPAGSLWWGEVNMDREKRWPSGIHQEERDVSGKLHMV